jgi:P pilus assembly chaperone PapD
MVLNASRVIIQNGMHEASFGIRNLDKNSPFLAQSWLTPAFGEEAVEHFSLTPQLAQVNGDGEQLVRILYEGVGLPEDKETMMWLNVQEIPKVGKETTAMRISVLQRIKVFYRPKGIQGSSFSANANIQWTQQGDKLTVSNPSMFHVTVINLEAAEEKIQDVLILSPGDEKTIDLSAAQQSILRKENHTLRYATVNDYGTHDRYQVVVVNADSKDANTPATPTRLK